MTTVEIDSGARVVLHTGPFLETDARERAIREKGGFARIFLDPVMVVLPKEVSRLNFFWFLFFSFFFFFLGLE